MRFVSTEERVLKAIPSLGVNKKSSPEKHLLSVRCDPVAPLVTAVEECQDQCSAPSRFILLKWVSSWVPFPGDQSGRASPSPYHYERELLNFLMLHCSSLASRPHGLVPLLAFLPDKATQDLGCAFLHPGPAKHYLSKEPHFLSWSHDFQFFSADFDLFQWLLEMSAPLSPHLSLSYTLASVFQFWLICLSLILFISLRLLQKNTFGFLSSLLYILLLSFFYISLFLFRFLA